MPGSSILGPLNLRKTSRNGVYELASESLDSFAKVGYLPLSSESVDDICLEESRKESDFDGSEKDVLLQHGYYEVDDIVDRWINIKT